MKKALFLTLVGITILLHGCSKNEHSNVPIYHVFDGASGIEDNSAVIINNSEIIICAYIDDHILLYKLTSNGTIEWTRKIRSDLRNPQYALAQTKNGDLFLCGSTQINVGKSEADVMLIKLNKDGEKLWEKTYGGLSDESQMVITSTTDDHLLIVTDSEDINTGREDLLLIKVSTEGEIVWEETIQSEMSDHGPYHVIETHSDNGFLISGVFWQQDGLSTALNIIKVNSLGKEVWRKIGEKDFQWGAVTEANNGDVLVCGQNTSNFSSQTMVKRFDSLGNLIWEKDYGKVDSLNVIGYSIKQNSDNTFTILGSANGNQTTNDNIIVFKINSIGEQLWFKTFGSKGNDRGTNLLKDNNDNNIITGVYNVTSKFVGLKGGLEINTNIFLSTIDSEGKFK